MRRLQAHTLQRWVDDVNSFSFVLFKKIARKKEKGDSKMKCIVCGKDAVKLIGNEIGRDVYAEHKPIYHMSAVPYPEYLAFCNKHDYEDYAKKTR